mgnify:CR=1 FL=1
MAALKYSRQRESIKHYLMTTKEHPTADTVYMHVKKEFPNISLGTVYRNIALFKDEGKVSVICNVNGEERIDGNTEPHPHFVCNKCNAVIEECGRLLDLDLDMKSIEEVNCLAGKNFDGAITSSSTLFFGKCGDCIKKS